jgi:UPF0755 protein
MVSNKIEPDSSSIIEAFHDQNFLEKNNFNKENIFSICLPNTYEFFWNISAEEFRDRMLKNYKLFWNKKREQARKKLKLSRVEVISLAAIVHKESYRIDERPKLARVYLNRLRRRMRLQADPTVIYAIMKKSNNYDLKIRRVLYNDLKIKSNYNTYRNRGLPPGPISMPDTSAIDAVLFSLDHNFLYFVVDPSRPGYHLFASDLKQHNKNKKIYTRWLREKNIYR